MDYHAVWWRLFHAPTASEWSNVLTFVQLLFSLPASIGKLECVFSQMNVIKTDKRSLLSNEFLLLMAVDSRPLKDLWWKEKVRRPHQNQGKKYSKCPHSTPSTSAVSSLSEEEPEDEDQTATDMLADSIL